MSIQELGSVGEFVAAIATIGTLLYLALQIRQNTVHARSEALRNATEAWVAQQRSAFRTEEDVAFMRRALNSYEDLNQDEKGRFFGVLIGYFSPFGDVYDKYASGLMDESVFRTIEDAFANVVRSPGAIDCINSFEKHTQLPPFIMDYVRGDKPDDRFVPPMTESFDFAKLKPEE